MIHVPLTQLSGEGHGFGGVAGEAFHLGATDHFLRAYRYWTGRIGGRRTEGG